jgi:hypothetical protein
MSSRVYGSGSKKRDAAVGRSAAGPGVGDWLCALRLLEQKCRVACREAAFLRCMFWMAALSALPALYPSPVLAHGDSLSHISSGATRTPPARCALQEHGQPSASLHHRPPSNKRASFQQPVMPLRLTRTSPSLPFCRHSLHPPAAHAAAVSTAQGKPSSP